MGQSSHSSPDRRKNFDIEEFMSKLANSPRKMDSSTNEDENSRFDSKYVFILYKGGFQLFENKVKTSFHF